MQPGEAVVRLARRSGSRPLAAAGVAALPVVRTASEIAPPLLVGRTVGSLDGSQGAAGAFPPAFTQAFTALCVAIVLRGILQYASAVAAARLGQDLENALRAELFAHVMRLRFRWHDETRSGK